MSKNTLSIVGFFFVGAIAIAPYSVRINAQPPASIHQATLMETGQKTKEVSTEELRKILIEKSAIVFDTRPFKEYAISHIPGAVNVAAKAGVPISLYVSDVAEIGRVLKGNKTAPIVLYCNGPFCGKSKRLAGELVEAGYTNVRRYQLGIPVWRSLGGLTQIEADGIRHVAENDRSAVFIDSRDAGEFKAGSIARAHNIPHSGLRAGKDAGEIKAAKDDGRLPMEDHNTRIIVFGRTAEQARAVAEAIIGEAFHNVSFFEGTFEQLRSTALAPAHKWPSATSNEIRVLSAVGMRQVLFDLAPKFERYTGVHVRSVFDSGAVIGKRLEMGEEADVVLLPRSSLDRLGTAGEFRASSLADVASSVVGVAVRKGFAKPDISTSTTFKLAMLNAKSIVCPDPALGGSSGLHIAKVFERLGIASAIKPKLILVSTPDKPETMPGHVLANGGAEVALHQMQELLAIPQIEVVGPLPSDLQTTFLFSAAVTSRARNGSAAQSFVDFLRSPAAKAVIKSIGMEPAVP